MSDATHKIVIVDDEQDILELLTFDFESAGYEVSCANSGNDAFPLIQSFAPDLVISDLRMPNGGGIDLFNTVIQMPREVRPKMMFITGYPVISIIDAFDRGVDGFVIKPFVRRDLVSYAQRILAPVPARWTEQASKQDKIKKVIKLEFNDFENAVKAHHFNLGRGGIVILNPSELPQVGDLVQFEIKFKSETGKEICGDGYVRWVRDEASPELPSGIGIDFQWLTAESVRFLAEEKRILELQSFIPKY